MPGLTIKNVRIVGLSACVPAKIEENLDLPIFSTKEEAKKVILSTGIERRHIVNEGTTAADLSVPAANKLLADLKWESREIDCLIYVCTSRDFIAPQTACILQDRLKLRNDCYVMDLPLGCSGWIYGMSVICSLMGRGTFKKGLLIAGETNTRNRNKLDRTVRPLFGDAATVTALEFNDEKDYTMNFSFGVNGASYQAVWTKYGGMRFPADSEAVMDKEIEKGIVRKGTDMVVNGMDVFAFAIKQPPKAIKEFIKEFDVNIDEIDLLLLHQANKFIDEKIRKSVGISADKVPYCLEEFGNVTSASIPLTMVSRCADGLENRDCHILACGFGVGLAWATMDFVADKITVSPLIEI